MRYTQTRLYVGERGHSLMGGIHGKCQMPSERLVFGAVMSS